MKFDKDAVLSLLGVFGATGAEKSSNCFYITGCKVVTNHWDLCIQREQISNLEFHVSDMLQPFPRTVGCTTGLPFPNTWRWISLGRDVEACHSTCTQEGQLKAVKIQFPCLSLHIFHLTHGCNHFMFPAPGETSCYRVKIGNIVIRKIKWQCTFPSRFV